MITLDTSGVVALLNARDPDHGAAVLALEQGGRPYLIPVGILSEIAYLLEARMPKVVDVFLGDLEEGAFVQDCGEHRQARVRALIARYADLPLGYADAAVIALPRRTVDSC